MHFPQFVYVWIQSFQSLDARREKQNHVPPCVLICAVYVQFISGSRFLLHPSFSRSLLHLTKPQRIVRPLASLSLSLSQLIDCGSPAVPRGAAFPLSSTSHPPRRFPPGFSPPSQSAPTACPGPPCHWSARRHTGLSDGPLGHDPSTHLWWHTPSGCPAGGAVEHIYDQSLTVTCDIWDWISTLNERSASFTSVCSYVSVYQCLIYRLSNCHRQCGVH